MIKVFLLKLRAEGWTQEAIAEKTGIRQGLISTLMKGGDCKASTLMKIADAYNVSTDTVLGRTAPEEHRTGSNNHKDSERRSKPEKIKAGRA
jgi:transcriptional regulator with XRE-family HTH domain